MVAGYSDPTIKFEQRFASVNGKKLEAYQLIKHNSSGSSETNRSQLRTQQLYDNANTATHASGTDSAYNMVQSMKNKGKGPKREMTEY